MGIGTKPPEFCRCTRRDGWHLQWLTGWWACAMCECPSEPWWRGFVQRLIAARENGKKSATVRDDYRQWRKSHRKEATE